MSWLFDDDITWCADSDRCKYMDCYRHLRNRKQSDDPDVYSAAYFMRTPDCAYYQEEMIDESNFGLIF